MKERLILFLQIATERQCMEGQWHTTYLSEWLLQFLIPELVIRKLRKSRIKDYFICWL